SIGVSVLGAALSHQVVEGVTQGLTRLGIAASAAGSTNAVPDLSTFPAPVRAVFESAFGEATGHIFLLAVPCAVVALVAIIFIREVPLRTTIERQDELAGAAPAPAPVAQPAD